MGKHSAMEQKNLKLKKLLSKERFPNACRIAIGEAYQRGELTSPTRYKAVEGACGITVRESANGAEDWRQSMYVDKPLAPMGKAVRKETRWGKPSWVVYHGCEVARIVPLSRYESAQECYEALCI